jgi:hypothetical protein
VLTMTNEQVQQTVERYRALFFPQGCKVNAYEQETYRIGERNAWSYLRRVPTDNEWQRHLDWTDEFWLAWPCARNSTGVCATDYIVFDIDAKIQAEAVWGADTVRRLAELRVRLVRGPDPLARVPCLPPPGSPVRAGPADDGREDRARCRCAPRRRNRHRPGAQGRSLSAAAPMPSWTAGHASAAGRPSHPDGVGAAKPRRCHRLRGRTAGCVINIDDLIASVARASAISPDTFATHEALDLEAALAYWHGGLTARGTRFRAMKQIIRGMLRYPDRFGLADAPSDREVGEAVAQWALTFGRPLG